MTAPPSTTTLLDLIESLAAIQAEQELRIARLERHVYPQQAEPGKAAQRVWSAIQDLRR